MNAVAPSLQTAAQAVGPEGGVTVFTGQLKAIARDMAVVVDARSSIPILTRVLLNVSGGKVEVTGTDLDTMVTADLPVLEGAASFTTCVDRRALLGVLEGIKGWAVSLCYETTEAGDTKLVLQAGASIVRLDTLDAEDFPVLSSTGTKERSLSIQARELSGLIKKTLPYVSTEETRYYLGGICFHWGQHLMVEAVATDGHKLIKTPVATYKKKLGQAQAIAPRKLCKALLPWLSRDLTDWVLVDFYKPAQERTDACASHHRVVISVPGWRFVSKVIDGTYPDYSRVIPTDTGTPLKLAREPLIEFASHAATAGGCKTTPVKFRCGPDNQPDTVLASFRMADCSSTVEQLLPGTTEWEGEFGVNSAYLARILRGMDGDTATFHITAHSDPIRISGPDTSVRVLMPMRV